MNTNIRVSKELDFKIHQVANQYQCALLFRCWMKFGILSVGLVLFFTIFLLLTRGAEISYWWPISLFVLFELILFGVTVIWPLRRPISNRQIALYIEEHHPDLENRIVTAVSLSEQPQDENTAWMVEKFFQESEQFTHRFTFAELLNQNLLVKLLLVTGGCFVVSLMIIFAFMNVWMPGLKSVFHEERIVLQPTRNIVEPGDVRVRKGDRQIILFETDRPGKQVSMQWKTADSVWTTEEMQQSTTENAYFHTFDNIQNEIRYQVISGLYQSKKYTITVWEPPHVTSIDVIYHYPEYIGREPKQISNAGDLTVLEGTRIEFEVQVKKPVRQAEIHLDNGETLELEKGRELTWNGTLTPLIDHTYSIHLTDKDGNSNEYVPQYKIEVEQDRPPEIEIDFPRRDYEVTVLEEVPFEFRVEDDFGIDDVSIQYEIAGREPVHISLPLKSPIGKNATGTYMLQLEQLELSPGDLITWSLQASDQKPDRDPYELYSDPYFLEIRPFRKKLQEAMSNAGAQQQQSGNQENQNNEAATQKDIIIATWNLRRDAKQIADQAFETKKNAILEAQKGLQTRFSDPSRMAMGGNQAQSIELLKTMEQIIESLESALLPDPTEQLSEAIRHEQQAHHLIMQMQPDTSQVQQRRSMTQGGSPGGRPEINELDLKRQRNYYEEERQTRQRLQESDESINKIKELAQRQENINDEISKLISELDMKQKEEELKRRLERLQEEEKRNLEKLDELEGDLMAGDLRDSNIRESLQRLQEARERMNRSLENLQNQDLQPARASGSKALTALDTMENDLQQFSREAAAQRMRDLQDKMAELIEKEEQIMDRIEELKKDQDSPSLTLNSNTDEEKQSIIEEKRELKDQVLNLIHDANELSERSERSQELMSQKLGDWLRRTSQKGIVEDIEQENRLPLVQYGIWDRAMEHEETILRKLQEAADDLNEVNDFMIGDDLEGMQIAVNELRNLLEEDRNRLSAAAIGSASGFQEAGERQAETNAGGRESDENQEESRGNQSASENENRGGQSASGNRNQGNQSSSDSEQGTRGGNQRNDNENNGNDITMNAGSGPGEDSGNRFLPGDPRSPRSMERFIESDYREWIDSLRNAERLMPGDRPFRDRLANVREEIEAMRDGYRRNRQPPKYDLFLEQIENPLVQTVREMEEEIQKRLSENEFVLTDDGNVPENYRKQVAEYFKSLAEAEIKR